MEKRAVKAALSRVGRLLRRARLSPSLHLLLSGLHVAVRTG